MGQTDTGYRYPEPSDRPDVPTDIRNLAEDVESLSGVPAGTMLDFGGASAPLGYLLCDGSLVARADFPRLFAAIGTLYGPGNGVDTFRLPDARGRVLVGFDGSQTAFNALGKTGGAVTHTLTAAEMPAHAHTVPQHGHTAWSNGSGDIGAQMTETNGTGDGYQAVRKGEDTGKQHNLRGSNHAHAIGVNDKAAFNTTPQGSSAAHNNLQPYVVATKIIKV